MAARGAAAGADARAAGAEARGVLLAAGAVARAAGRETLTGAEARCGCGCEARDGAEGAALEPRDDGVRITGAWPRD